MVHKRHLALHVFARVQTPLLSAQKGLPFTQSGARAHDARTMGLQELRTADEMETISAVVAADQLASAPRAPVVERTVPCSPTSILDHPADDSVEDQIKDQAEDQVDDRAEDPTTIDSLSDDDYAHIIQVLHNGAAVLPLVLTSARWREAQRVTKVRLLTAVTDLASSMGLISWAISAGCPYPASLSTDVFCRAAAKHGAIDVMTWARENGCPWEVFHPLPTTTRTKADQLTTYHNANQTTIRTAARGGHTRFIETARQLGCQWGLHPMYDAAVRGHLETLRRMHELDCPINDMVCYGAHRHAFGHQYT